MTQTYSDHSDRSVHVLKTVGMSNWFLHFRHVRKQVKLRLTFTRSNTVPAKLGVLAEHFLAVHEAWTHATPPESIHQGRVYADHVEPQKRIDNGYQVMYKWHQMASTGINWLQLKNRTHYSKTKAACQAKSQLEAAHNNGRLRLRHNVLIS